MGNRSIIGVKGLNTSDNPLELPPGTLIQADNVVVRNRGTVEPRTGEAELGELTEFVLSLYARWRDTTIVHLDFNTLGHDEDVYGGFYDEVLTYRVRMRFAEAQMGLYFASRQGVHLLHTPSVDPALAGVPRAPDLDFVASKLTGNPAAGWMPVNSQVAGRSVFGIKDANGNLKLGAPSGPLIITNPANQTIAIGGLVRTGGNTVTVTFPAAHGYRVGDIFALSGSVDANFVDGNKTVVTAPSSTTLTYTEAGANGASTDAVDISSGAKNILWRVTLPPDITTSHFFQLHRGAVSATAATQPDDEMFLVFEGAIAAGDITAGYVDYTDRTPESVLGLFGSTPLYTNANTGDGALAARFRPPRAVDILWWDNRMWFANTIDVGRRTVTLLGIGSPSGLQDGDTVTVTVGVDVEVFTARTSPAAANDFQIYADGTASQNIERTARALVAKIHSEHASANAYYASAPDDAPGAIQVETVALAASLTIAASRLTAWSPTLPATGETDTRTNGVSYSEVGLPESVPLLNYLAFGASNVEVMRILPLRDKLLVMTWNGGLWLVSGPAPYRVDALDPTVDLRHPDTAVTHSGMVYAYTTHGVVAISDSGVRIISQPLEEPLRDFELRMGVTSPPATRAFGVTRETLHEYQLFLPTTAQLPQCPEAYVFNSLYQAWTRRTGSRTCAAENASGILILGDGDEEATLSERTAGNDPISRLADKEFNVTVISYVDRTYTLSSVAGITAGDMFWDSDEFKSVIESVDPATNTITIASFVGSVGSTARIYVAFECAVKFAPDTAGQPGLFKQNRDAVLHFKRLNTWQEDLPNNKTAGQVNATFESEVHPAESVVRVDNAGYGLQPYGSGAWGNPLSPADERVGVPQERQKCRQLKVGFSARQAGADWELCGYSIEGELISERGR